MQASMLGLSLEQSCAKYYNIGRPNIGIANKLWVVSVGAGATLSIPDSDLEQSQAILRLSVAPTDSEG